MNQVCMGYGTNTRQKVSLQHGPSTDAFLEPFVQNCHFVNTPSPQSLMGAAEKHGDDYTGKENHTGP